jgi:hypothetical protein
LVELGIPELSIEQTEALCALAENAARKYILSKVSSRMVERLDISVEAEGSKPVNVSVEINLALTAEAKNVDAQALVNEATRAAYEAVEKSLRKLK